jgi:uncharacterized membrane protein YidH (DUF202 family)
MTEHSEGVPTPAPQVWDEGLQNERTTLAWGRSTLALLGCALLVARLATKVHPTVGVALAAAALILAGTVARVTSARYHRASAALSAGRPLPDGKLAALTTALLLLIGVGSVALIARTL